MTGRDPCQALRGCPIQNHTLDLTRQAQTPAQDSLGNKVNLLERRWVRWGLYLSFWTLLGLFNAGQSCFLRASLGKPIVWWKLVAAGLVDWYLWAALAPFVMLLARRYPLEQGVWGKHVPIHIALSLMSAFLTSIVVFPVMLFIGVWPANYQPIPERFYRFFVDGAQLYALVYWAILGVSHAMDYYHKFRERELKASQLESRLAQAQLQVLKMQLDPHFLFNTLNAISTLIHADPDAAERMLVRLGDMLRLSLESTNVHEVSLRQELGAIEPYLEIQCLRFRDRLSLGVEIDPEAMDALVPNLILQPIVENSIRHGIEPQSGSGKIRIRAWHQENWLKIQILDNGPGICDELPSSASLGVGIANTRSRLGHLYGSSQSFEISNAQEGGAVVTLNIPWHTLDLNGLESSDGGEQKSENPRTDRG